MTPEDMEALSSNRFWWMRGDRTFYSTPVKDPENLTDIYLLDASPQWQEQWADWQEAVDALTPLLEKL